jgi:hypothetical protein
MTTNFNQAMVPNLFEVFHFIIIYSLHYHIHNKRYDKCYFWLLFVFIVQSLRNCISFQVQETIRDRGDSPVWFMILEYELKCNWLGLDTTVERFVKGHLGLKQNRHGPSRHGLTQAAQYSNFCPLLYFIV